MDQFSVTKRLAALIAIPTAAFFAFAGGLALMNVRADWALATGGLICIAAPLLGGVGVWAMLSEDKRR